MEALWVVSSRTQDECSMCNRVFSTYEEAADWVRHVEENVGCVMYGPVKMRVQGRLAEWLNAAVC